MLHRIALAVLTATALAAVAVSSAAAQPATAHSGEATALSANILGIEAAFAPTGALPAEGGKRTASFAGVDLLGLVQADALTASTQGQGNESHSSAAVSDLAINVLGIAIGADAVRSRAVARCQGGEPQVEGSSQLVGLTVLGEEIVGVNAPRLEVPLPLGFTLFLNEQTSSTEGQHGEITVNAVHLVGPAVDVVVASSTADIDCAPESA